MIYAVAHNKGGVGKTTITLNLAAELAPDIIIDQDTHQSLIIINQLRDTPYNVVRCDSRQELIKVLKQSQQEKTILIDCGGFDSELTRIAVAAADVVIVPSNGNTTERIGLRRFDTVLGEVSQQMGKHINAHVMVSRVHHAKRNFDKLDNFLANAKHMTRLSNIVASSAAYDDATEKGLAVSEYKRTKYSDAASQTKRVAQEIAQLTLQK